MMLAKRTRVALLLAVALASVGAPRVAYGDEPRAVIFRTQTMGTWASLTLVTPDSAAVAEVAYETLLVFHRVDSLMSNWTDVSEVARINREAAEGEITVHPEVAEVLAFAEVAAAESDGAFDITVEPLVRLWGFIGGPPRVPAKQEIDAVLERVGHDKLLFDAERAKLRFARDDVRIDLGGIAKGYAVDRAAEILRAQGIENALLDLSGNMVAVGKAANRESGWIVGVRDPSGNNEYLARIRLDDQAIATSGDYEQFVAADGKRYGHILDPRTGYSASGLTSVTVLAERAMVADAWATALFVLGPDTARRVATERQDLAVVLVEPTRSGDIVWVEEQLRPHFETRESSVDEIAVRFF